MNEQKIYKAAIDAFGVPAQVDMLIEEMAELTQALLKWRRRGGNITENTHEEFSDVEIVMGQIKTLLSTERLNFWKEYKLERLQERIKNHE